MPDPTPELDPFHCRSCWAVSEPGARSCAKCQADLAPLLPEKAVPRLRVIRGMKRDATYFLEDGENVVGFSDVTPVHVDLEEQFSPTAICIDRRHSVITWQGDLLTIHDLNSSYGT